MVSLNIIPKYKNVMKQFHFDYHILGLLLNPGRGRNNHFSVMNIYGFRFSYHNM